MGPNGFLGRRLNSSLAAVRPPFRAGRSRPDKRRRTRTNYLPTSAGRQTTPLLENEDLQAALLREVQCNVPPPAQGLRIEPSPGITSSPLAPASSGVCTDNPSGFPRLRPPTPKDIPPGTSDLVAGWVVSTWFLFVELASLHSLSVNLGATALSNMNRFGTWKGAGRFSYCCSSRRGKEGMAIHTSQGSRYAPVP